MRLGVLLATLEIHHVVLTEDSTIAGLQLAMLVTLLVLLVVLQELQLVCHVLRVVI